MTITVYGIKSCSTMKKAFNKLDELGVSYEFHDYKKQGIDKDTVQRWVNALGVDKVLNKRGTTWRKLDDAQKQAADATRIISYRIVSHHIKAYLFISYHLLLYHII